MKRIDSPHHHLPRTNWQTLGHLKLKAGPSSNGTIGSWLINALNALSLPDDLVSRLWASMEDVTARVLSGDGAEGQIDFLEIVLLVPSLKRAKKRTWGFFRVERVSTDALDESAKGHCVEYYLYLDTKAGK